MRTDDLYKDTAEDVETRFDTSNYEIDRLLTKGENPKNRWTKNELGGKVMKEFFGLKA